MHKDEDIKAKDFEEAVDHGIPKQLLQMEGSVLKETAQFLEEAMSNHLTSMNNEVNEWGLQILHAFEEAQIQFNDMEKTDLLTNEPITAIHDRFVEFKIELPELKNDTVNFHDYFILKSILVLQSMLSRQHLPHQLTDIQIHLDKIKNPLKHIQEAETALFESQKAALHQIMAPLEHVK